jgi:ankyrin repeat protein
MHKQTVALFYSSQRYHDQDQDFLQEENTMSLVDEEMQISTSLKTLLHRKEIGGREVEDYLKAHGITSTTWNDGIFDRSTGHSSLQMAIAAKCPKSILECFYKLNPASLYKRGRHSLQALPIHIACVFENIHALNWLIQKGVNLNATDSKKQTALYICAANGASTLLTTLLTAGASQRITGPKWATPLSIAADRGHCNCVKQLLEFMPDPSIFLMFVDDGRSPIFLAAQNGHDKVLAELLRFGKSIAKKGPVAFGNFTPLHVAAQRGHIKCVELLIKYGGYLDEADSEGYTPMHSAAFAGIASIVKLLLHHGASIVAKTNDGLDMLTLAACSGNLQCVHTVLSFDFTIQWDFNQTALLLSPAASSRPNRKQNFATVVAFIDLLKLLAVEFNNTVALPLACIFRDSSFLVEWFRHQSVSSRVNKTCLMSLCSNDDAAGGMLPNCKETTMTVASALCQAWRPQSHYLYPTTFRAMSPFICWVLTTLGLYQVLPEIMCYFERNDFNHCTPSFLSLSTNKRKSHFKEGPGQGFENDLRKAKKQKQRCPYLL